MSPGVSLNPPRSTRVVEAAIDDIAIETFTAGVAAVTDGGTRATADLEQNRPNPFRPGAALTNIRFALSNPGDAKLAIFDASGRLVRTLLQGPMQSGAHTPVWNALDDNGKEVGAGVHFCRLTSGGFEQSRGLANDIDTIYTYDNAAFARVPGLSVLAP